MKEKSEESRRLFNRKTLRTVYLLKSNKGNFCIRTYILDKNSLNIQIVNSYFTEQTLQMVIGIYMSEFLDLSKMAFDDTFRNTTGIE